MHSSVYLTTGQNIISGIQPWPANAAATLLSPRQTGDPLSLKGGVEVVAFARQGTQIIPRARVAVGVAIAAGPGMPGGAGEVDRVGGSVHANGIGQECGSVSRYLAISDKRNGLSGS